MLRLRKFSQCLVALGALAALPQAVQAVTIVAPEVTITSTAVESTGSHYLSGSAIGYLGTLVGENFPGVTATTSDSIELTIRPKDGYVFSLTPGYMMLTIGVRYETAVGSAIAVQSTTTFNNLIGGSFGPIVTNDSSTMAFETTRLAVNTGHFGTSLQPSAPITFDSITLRANFPINVTIDSDLPLVIGTGLFTVAPSADDTAYLKIIPVPEPGTALLLSLGLTVLCTRRSNRRLLARL